MMRMTLNIMGVKTRVDYGSVSPGPEAITVIFTEKDNNQTEFSLHSNPENLPLAAIRLIVRAIHEQLIRLAKPIPSPLFIIVEK